MFKRWGKNMIDWVMFDGDEVWKSMNHTKVDLSGFEIFAKKTFNLPMVSKTMSSNIEVNYSYTHADKDSDNLMSYYVLDYLKHKLDIILTLPIHETGGISLNISRQHRVGDYLVYEDGTYAGKVSFEPAWISGLKVYHGFNNVQIFTEVSNLFDTNIVDIANVPQPGRWFRLGLSYSRNNRK